MSEPVTIALIGFIVGPSIGVAFGYWLNRDKLAAETAASETAANASVAAQWQAWAQEQGTRIERLEGRVLALEAEGEAKDRHIDSLSRQIDKYRRTITALIGHVTRLRESLAHDGADIPEMPTDVSEAVTTFIAEG